MRRIVSQNAPLTGAPPIQTAEIQTAQIQTADQAQRQTNGHKRRAPLESRQPGAEG
jgi:hypothetical protein